MNEPIDSGVAPDDIQYFPFKITPDMPHDEQKRRRDAMGEAIWGCRAMIRGYIRKQFRYDDNRHVDKIDDIESFIIRQLLASLPKYDARRGAKISTFIYFTMTEAAVGWVRHTKTKRFKRNAHKQLTDEITVHLTHVRHDGEEKIEAISDDIMAHPERYMTTRQAAIFKAYADPKNHGILLGDLSKKLGYATQASLSMLIARLRDRLSRIDLTSWSPHGKVIFNQPDAD